jgi:LPXTG-motif cell wall-anchored protein
MPEPSPGSGLSSEAEHLACGANVDELLEQVADGHADELTDHQSGCEYCQAALTEFTALWSPVALAAAAPFVVPAGLAGSLTAAVMADVAKLPTTPAPSPSAATRPPLQRWLPQLIAVVVVAAIIAVIVLVSRHHGSKPSGTVPVGIAASASTVAPLTPAPTTAAPTTPASRPAPTVTATAPSRAIPTAVPAGNGGQAAATTTGTRDEQLAMLLAGVVLVAAGGGYLVRRRR